MALFKLDNFSGVVPRRSPELLAPNQAQTANNVKLWSGEIRAWSNTLPANNPSKGAMAAATAVSLFHYSADAGEDANGAISAVANTSPVAITTSAAHGRTTGDRVYIDGTGLSIDEATYVVTVTSTTAFTLDSTTAAGTATTGTWVVENGFWFHWASDVDAVLGPVAGDTNERVYITDGTQAKMTYASIATAGGGTDYPTNTYDLGVPAPELAATVVVSGTAPADPNDYVSRAYVYTYVSALGEEGPPSPASTIVDVGPDQTATLSAMDTGPASGSYNLTHKRIYRLNTGTTSAEYQYVTQITLATTGYADSLADASLGEVLETTSWDPPPAELKGLCSMANGMLVGFKGHDVYFSIPYAPHAYPVLYRQTTADPVVAVASLGESVVVATERNPYIMTGSHPSNVSSTEVEIYQACVSKRSMVDMGDYVVYAGPDGLVLIGPGMTDLVTKSFFTRDEWQALNPKSMHAYRYDNRYVCFYDDGSTQAGFIFDPAEDNASLTFIDTYATGGYNDPVTDTLYLYIDDKLQAWDSGSSSLTYTWKSKPLEAPMPLNPGAAQVIASSYPLTFNLYADGVLKHTRTVLNNRPFRLPAGYRGRLFEVQVSGTASIKAVLVATTMKELSRE